MLTLRRVIKHCISDVVPWPKKPVRRASYKTRPLKLVSSSSHVSLLSSCRRNQKYIAQIMLSAYLSAPGVLLAQGATAASNSAHAPAFDTSASGIPIVNINAPSSKGVSRNEYETLNVESKGLIFNNATDIAKTELAGYIDGNARLGGKSASIILNEVTGNSRSALNGYMEIAGKSAELIIANQNGITCNGCGFINTTRGTLTTGQALFDGAGGLSGFDVSRGDIAITGQGLNDTNTDELDILARSVKLNAKLWADNVTIITGDNRINYQDKSVTARSNGEREEFALDVAAIGGMYANRIRLIGTEKGLGVNLGGEVKAVDDMVLDTQGNLVHSATLSADAVKIQANNIENTGAILANRLTIDSTEEMTNKGADASIQATSAITLKTQTLQNLDGAKLLSQNGDVGLTSHHFENQGTVAGKTLKVDTSTLNNTGESSQIFAVDQLTLTTTGDLTNQDGATIASDDQLTITAQGQLTNLTGAIESLETLNIEAQSLTNTGSLSTQNGALTLTTGQVDNQGILAGKGIIVNANALTNSTANGKVYSTDKLDLNITGDVTNKDGALVHADSNMTLETEGKLTNTDSTLEAVNNTTLLFKGFSNTANSLMLAENGTLDIQVGSLDGDGVFSATGPLNNHGALKGQQVKVTATAIHNDKSTSKMAATGDLTLTATQGKVSNTNGASLSANNTLTIAAATDLINTGANIESAQDISLSSQNLKNTENALIRANDSITLDWHGALTNNNAKIEAQNNIHTTQSTDEASNPRSGSLTNASTGLITAQNGTLNLTLGNLTNYGSIGANRVTLNTNSLLNKGSSGLILANKHLDLSSNSNLNNYDGASLFSLGGGKLYAKGNLTNSSASIEARGGDLTIDASKLINKRTSWEIGYRTETKDKTESGKVYVIREGGGSKKKHEGVSYYYAGRTSQTGYKYESAVNRFKDNSNVRLVGQKHYDFERTIVTPYIRSISSEGEIYSSGIIDIIGDLENNASVINGIIDVNITGEQKNIPLILIQTVTDLGEEETEKRYSPFSFGVREKKDIDGGNRSTSYKYVSDIIESSSKPYKASNTNDILLESSIISAGENLTGKGGSLQNVGSADTVSKELSRSEIIEQRQNAIFGDLSVEDFIRSAQFASSQRPDSGYLIETNSLFTNYKTFISSDYLLNKTIGDGQGRTGKTASRLGDGFLEQQLVRDQILSYTGLQSLPDQVDIESTYATLMNNALKEYKDLKLSTGVELTDGQVAKLKQPIVWMVTETVQTPSGPQDVLVPKVYFSNSTDMTLRPDGALVAANNIDIQVDGDLANSGSIVAKSNLSLSGDNLTNSGAISAGASANLKATGDISNSGSMQSKGTLSLAAGGDISSETQQEEVQSVFGTKTLVGQTASLKGSNVILNAGNDINLIANDLNAEEQLSLQAGNDLTLSSIAVTETEGVGNYYQQATTQHQTNTLSANNIQLIAGNDVTSEASQLSAEDTLSISAGNDLVLSSVADSSSYSQSSDQRQTSKASVNHQVNSLAGANIQLSAGNTLTSEGAQLNAQEDLTLSADNIDLLAVKDTKDNHSFVGGGGNSTEKRSHNESIIGTDLIAGGALTLVSQNDIISKGSNLSGDEGIALVAGGDVVLATETARNSSYEQVKKKKSGMFGSKRSTTTTTSESLSNQGTNLASAGNISISSGNDLVLSGSKASADGNISLQAGGDIQLLSAVDQTSNRYQEQKKGTFKVKTKDQGAIKQTAVTSDLIGAGNVSLNSGSNITLEGSTLAANDTLSIGTEAVTQNAQGQYVNADGEQAGNITVGTKVLQSSEWDESSSSYRGVLKDLAKGIAVVGSVVSSIGGGDGVQIKIGEARSKRTDSKTHQTSTLASNDLNIDALQDVTFIGTDISVADTANISANNVTFDAAQNQVIVTESYTTTTVASGDGSNVGNEAVSVEASPMLAKNSEQDSASNDDDSAEEKEKEEKPPEGLELTVAEVSVVDLTKETTTQSNTWRGSNVQVGNLNITAKKNVGIIASDVTVQNDANIKADNILVGGREDETITTQTNKKKVETLTVGIRNAYADAYTAGETLDYAKSQERKAQRAYDEAKQQVEDGKMPKGDLDAYDIKLKMAKKSVKTAELAVVTAIASAAANSGTMGFTASAGASIQESSSSLTATQGTWNGSSIRVGNNASLNSDNNLTVEGSAIAAQGTLEANAKNIDIKAGKNTYTEETSSTSKGVSASVTVGLGGDFSSGFDMGSVSGSAGVNTSKSSSHSQSTQYTNSSLSAGSLKSNSEKLTLEGGNLHGDKVAINTQELDVISLQDTAKSTSKSEGGGLSLSMGSSTSTGPDQTVTTTDTLTGGINYNRSKTHSDYASVTQQSSITSGDQGYQINVAGNTNLVGGLITSTDAAEEAGNNRFSTGTLTQRDLENHAEFGGSSFGIDMSLSASDTSGGAGNAESKVNFSKNMGYGSISDHRKSTTQSGINTASLVITDEDQQTELTGKSVAAAVADVKTTTNTDNADLNSGALQNNFNQAEVEALVNSERDAKKNFDGTVSQIKGMILSKQEALEKNKDQMSPEEYEDQSKALTAYGLLASTIGAGLTAPTDSVSGQLAAAASPTVAYGIGQYFKGLAAENDNGQLNAGQETAHVLAHGILAAAVAAEGGNDATTAGIAAAGSEAAAPALAQWLYGSSDPNDLTAEQKQTLTAVIGAASTAVGATTGNGADTVSTGQLAENAVDNNFLGPYSEEETIAAAENLHESNNAQRYVDLQFVHQRSDELKNKYQNDPDSMSSKELEELGFYLEAFVNENMKKYDGDVKTVKKMLALEFSNTPKWENAILDYQIPFALPAGSEAKESAIDRYSPSLWDHLTFSTDRNKPKSAKVYSEAKAIIKTDAYYDAHAKIGTDILSTVFVSASTAADVVKGAAEAFLTSDADTAKGVVIDVGSNIMSNIFLSRVRAPNATADYVKDVAGNSLTLGIDTILSGEESDDIKADDWMKVFLDSAKSTGFKGMTSP
ncbi:hemagglutinin repeat-containing protein [Marinomonas posidonica]|uniref:Filamentous hemagglutinin family outer membrane protein n=1 Tax=Marinomonas posidonica (strain CECT 7376 / NCIMB 14433 / IVIA-Po-181) TaxID=491952 RepID=F6CUT6_MARPP|nr:hemagglutinin repeat-containing protein [Marinomonas posidonica]AEF55262.1 filamentous hemagglutinin family outer membrane protein [Marinomonas posidonica IVIA-Po-181]